MEKIQEIIHNLPLGITEETNIAAVAAYDFFEDKIKYNEDIDNATFVLATKPVSEEETGFDKAEAEVGFSQYYIGKSTGLDKEGRMTRIVFFKVNGEIAGFVSFVSYAYTPGCCEDDPEFGYDHYAYHLCLDCIFVKKKYRSQGWPYITARIVNEYVFSDIDYIINKVMDRNISNEIVMYLDAEIHSYGGYKSALLVADELLVFEDGLFEDEDVDITIENEIDDSDISIAEDIKLHLNKLPKEEQDLVMERVRNAGLSTGLFENK